MAKDFSKIMLGEGVLTYNDGATDIDLGYTRGGVFNDNVVFRHIEVDGKKGNVVGDAVLETCIPTLEFKMVQMDSAMIDKVFANITVTDATGVKTIKRSVANIASTEYLDDVTFVGKTVDGKDVSIKILKALGEGALNFTYTDKGEVEIPCTFTGNYNATTDTEAPFELIIDESV